MFEKQFPLFRKSIHMLGAKQPIQILNTFILHSDDNGSCIKLAIISYTRIIFLLPKLSLVKSFILHLMISRTTGITRKIEHSTNWEAHLVSRMLQQRIRNIAGPRLLEPMTTNFMIHVLEISDRGRHSSCTHCCNRTKLLATRTTRPRFPWAPSSEKRTQNTELTIAAERKNIKF